MREPDLSELKTWHRGRLPHWQVPGMTVFLTFRLWDSLPASVVRAYDEERRILERRMAREGQTRELRLEAKRLFSDRIESALDAGMGSCLLQRTEYAELVLGALRFLDGERYVLHAACLMPNHAHVVVTLEPVNGLSETTHSWKSFTVNQAQRRFGHQGSLWQDESYDHIVRDGEEFSHYVRYTLENPQNAGLRNWPHVHRLRRPPCLRRRALRVGVTLVNLRITK